MGTAEAENVDIYSVCFYNLFSWKLFIKWILIPCMNGVQFRVILLYFFWFETHQTITCSKINFQSVRGMQGWTNLPLRTRFFGHAILLARPIRLSKKGCTKSKLMCTYLSVYIVLGRNPVILSKNSSPLNNSKLHFKAFVDNNTKFCVLRKI